MTSSNFNEKNMPPVPNIASSSYIPPLPYTKHSLCSIPPLPEISSANSIKTHHFTSNNNSPRTPMSVTQANFSSRYDYESKFPNVSSSLAGAKFSSNHMNIPKPPMALPRSMPKHHIVDIIPKPILNKAQSIPALYSSSPDQTQNAIKPMVHNTYISSSFTKVHENLVKPPAPIFQYPLISGQIPRQSVQLNYASKFSNSIQCNTKVPPPPSVTNAKAMLNLNQDQSIHHPKQSSSINNPPNGTGSKQSGEKNKVKFSDTVTVAVVPVSKYFSYSNSFQYNHQHLY